MPGFVPELDGKKWAYFKLKRGIMMNTNVSGPIEGVLSRREMKKIMAGAGDGSAWVTCKNCQNESCQGWADDCTAGAYEMCGPGEAGTPGPAPHDCVEIN